MSQAPSIPPSIYNIHPLGDHPTDEQMDFILSRSGREEQKAFGRLSFASAMGILRASMTGDRSQIEATERDILSFAKTQAERISRTPRESSSTAAPSSQPRTGQGPVKDVVNDTQDGASTKAPETANDQE